MNRRNGFVLTLMAMTMAGLAGCALHGAESSANRPAATEASAANTNASNAVATTAPVYVPDITRESDALPDGVFAWNSLLLVTNVSETNDAARFTVAFTNISSGKVAIMDVHPSCGCTTAELPQRPWIIEAGQNGAFPVSVNLNATGRQGPLFKSVKITTDKGFKEVYLRITIDPIKMADITEADRERFMAMSKADRQAIFKDDCVRCHVKKGEGKYGQALYEADCAICHDAEQRAAVVPDLHKLKVPTNPDFWRQWITHGKPGSLMAAFSTAEGGPLNDMQIKSLVDYLSQNIPSTVPSPQ